MRPVSFAKYEGLGNDFVVVEAADESMFAPESVRGICDRRLGVGADGVLLVLSPRASEADVRMKVINADGSVPEMCGNGLRCVALHASRGRTRVRVETDSGVRECSVDGNEVTVDMGLVGSLGSKRLDLDGKTIEVWVADAGNPHAVSFADAPWSDIRTLGPQISTHPSFVEGTNAGFASLAGGGIDLQVWERGVGPTRACGTGACAAVAVACDRGLLPTKTPITVRLPGGELRITVMAVNGVVSMRGAARLVFTGEIQL